MILKYAGISLLAVAVILVPFWLIIVNSFKPLNEANSLGLGLPDTWVILENYRVAFVEGRFLRGLLNTVLVVVPSVTLIVLLSGAAAWVFARDKSRSMTVVYFVLISGALIPPAIITSIVVIRWLGIWGTRGGAVAFYVGLFSAFAIFFITGFVRTVPRELEEAARVDGAGPITIYLRIIFPLLVPILVTTSLIMMLIIWNDFFYPIFLLPSPDQQTLTLGLQQFASAARFQVRWNLLFANLIIVSLPLFIVFFFAQRKIVSGLTGGGVK